MTIDKLCLWKVSEQDPKGTTFIDVRNKPDHKLYACIACDGYNKECPIYQDLLLNVWRNKHGN